MKIDNFAHKFKIDGNVSGRNPLFRKLPLEHFPDVSIHGANLHELYNGYVKNSKLVYVTKNRNKIIVDGQVDIGSLKNTTVFFSGSDNVVTIRGLRNVAKLDLVCVNQSKISIGSPTTIRGMTVFCAHESEINIGENCMISRDIIVYSSKAHGLYSVADGSRRSKSEINIGDRVWIGQGVRVLAGAKVGNGSVIGSYSVLAGRIPNNCAAAGNPCRVTTKDIFWTDHAVPEDGNYFEMLTALKKPIPEYIRPTED